MKKLWIWVIVVLLIGFLIYYFNNKNKVTVSSDLTATSTPATTTSTTSNSVPVDITGWISGTSNGFTFQYPKDLGTKYIRTVDWPIKLAVEDKPFDCLEAGTSEAMPPGKTKLETVNGHQYCVTRVSEGAAGSTYTMYAYKMSYNDKSLIATFSLRQPQCMNYDNPEQTECQKEENNFSISPIVDAIASTIK